MEAKGKPFVIMLVAVAIVAALSFVPWGSITGGVIKDYDLLSSLRPDSLNAAAVHGDEIVDPELLSALQEMTEADPEPPAGATEKPDTLLQRYMPLSDDEMVDEAASRVDGAMVIEDYTPDGNGLEHLAAALRRGNARIAVIGDSYIEGDILTQDIRQQLQSRYGGYGAGYVPATSIVAGFRRTVSLKQNGFRQVPIREASRSPHFTLMGEYFVGDDGATVTYTGAKRDPLLGTWQKSTLLFIAPNDGSVTLAIDGDTLVMPVQAAENVQCASISGPTSSLKITNNVPGLIFLGAYLDGAQGVSVDCMSVRGDSGISHRKISPTLAAQLRQWVDYDLIIVEYGINALNSEQSDYSGYSKLMTDVLLRLRECYPQADILMLAVGDRGQKMGTDVHSIPNIENMVDNQRKAARRAGCLFWDTREAMGGKDAIVQWRERGLVNPDYIHLNSKGGKALATELVQSIINALPQ